MDFRILGSLEVLDADGRPVVLVGRVRALLAVLLLHANETVSVDRLIDELWGDRSPATARKVVRNLVSQLRKTLGDRLETRGQGYRLRVEAGELDLDRFTQLVREADDSRAAGDPAASVALLREALSLWRGPALDDLGYEQLTTTWAAHLDELRLTALEKQFDAELALGSDGSLVAELEQLVAAQPLRERLRGQLMLALYRAGRQADALATYGDARQVLVEQLGLEPTEELQRLQQAILRHDRALTPPPTPTSGEAAATESSARARAVPRVLRRPWILAAAGLLLVIAAAAAAGIELSRGGGRASTAAPNSLAVVDPADGRLLATVVAGSRPTAVAVGAGAVWVANADDGTVSRVDPKKRNVVDTIGVGGPLAGIAADQRSVWVVTGGEGKLVEIDPRTNAVVLRRDLSGRNDLMPAGAYTVAVGGGSVWVGSDIAGGSLLRFDPKTGQVSTVVTKGSAPSGIAVSDDSVWAAFPLGGTVRAELTNNKVTAGIDQPPNAVSLAVGGGSVWVGEMSGWSGGPSAVWQIAPATATAVHAIPVAGVPLGMAVAEGRIWVAGDDGALTEIDPHRLTVTRSRPLSRGALQAVAYGAGALWIAVADEAIPSEVPAEGRSDPRRSAVATGRASRAAAEAPSG